MSLQTLPYLLVYITAFIVSVAIFNYSWKNRSAAGVQAFSIAILLEISWLVGYIFEINSASLAAKVFWDNFQYFGAFYAPIGLLIFSIVFVGWKVNERRLAILLGIIPTLILVAVVANVNPESIRINTQVVPGLPYDELTYDYGLLTTIGNYYLYMISLAYLVVLGTGFRRKERSFLTQLWIVLLGTGVPIVGLIIGQLIGFKFANQRDTSPLLFAVSNAVIAFGVFRFRLFNILPIAREALFENIDDVLIILNAESTIVDVNPSARQLLSNTVTNPIGVHIGSIFPDLFAQFANVNELHTEIAPGNNALYEIKITPLYDRSQHFIGRLINAHDITRQKQVEQEIKKTSELNQRRASQFQAIANVASTIASLQNQEQMLTQVVQTISDQLGHYHVGIFLLDELKAYAILKSTNSTGGRRMLDRGHKLEVGETGIVGLVSARGKPRIALDTGTDAVYFNNPDLPDTKSEVALPLLQGNEVIGVLDVQSTMPNAFTQDDINTLTILANQVSITIQNTILYEENITALENAEKAYQQLAGESWKKALKSQTVKGYMYDGTRSQPLPSNFSGGHSVAVPVNLRGQNIGELKLEALDPDREWTEEELAMITAAAERAALALENARLLAESQKRAAKERTIGEISAKISAQTDIDALLKIAVLELNRTLPAVEVAVQFSRGQEAE